MGSRLPKPPEVAVPEEPTPLHLSTRELARAVDRINCGVMARDRDSRILYANDRLHRWLGYEREELVGKPVSSLVPEELREVLAIEMESIQSGDERARLNVLQRKDCTTFPVIVLPHPMRDENDEYDGSIVLFIDLGTVQTAKPLGIAAQGDVRSTLGRIALELQSITLSAELPTSRVPLHHPDLSELSPRETEVLGQLVGGSRVPAIAEQLHISQHTVRNHLKSIYRKAGVQGQSDLIQWVRSLGE
jgi:PAS domain S-box-containing protein